MKLELNIREDSRQALNIEKQLRGRAGSDNMDTRMEGAGPTPIKPHFSKTLFFEFSLLYASDTCV
jgi:hypothetical protein